MLSNAFSDALALVYYVCFLSLIGMTIFVASGIHRSKSRATLRTTFVLLALCLLSWQATMFFEVRTTLPIEQIWVGRFNFAIVAVVVYLGFMFVRQIAAQESERIAQRHSGWLLAETGLLFALTMFTPLIDAAEQVIPIAPGGRAITIFGPLYPLYLFHILSYLILAIKIALKEHSLTRDNRVRRQLEVVSFGSIATCVVAFVSNALFPYIWNDFRYCDIGTISVQVLVLCDAYATFVHGLFDAQVIIRKTLVYGLLMVFVLSAYSSAVFLITEYLTVGAGRATQFLVLIIAFSMDPLRRFMEAETDKLLFDKRRENGQKKKRRRKH